MQNIAQFPMSLAYCLTFWLAFHLPAGPQVSGIMISGVITTGASRAVAPPLFDGSKLKIRN